MEAGVTATSAEERQRQLEARHENIRLITGMGINAMEHLRSLSYVPVQFTSVRWSNHWCFRDKNKSIHCLLFLN